MPDLISGQVQVVFSPIPQVLELIRTGKLRALAATPQNAWRRCRTFPPWASLCPATRQRLVRLAAPKDTPGEIVNKLSEAMNVALADPKAKARLNELGVAPMPLTPAEFEKFIAAETDKWAKVIKSSGIKPE